MLEAIGDSAWLENAGRQLEQWFVTEVWSLSTLSQAAAVLGLAILAVPLARLVRSGGRRMATALGRFGGASAFLTGTLPTISLPIVLLGLLVVVRPAFGAPDQPAGLLTVLISLLAAWVVIQLAASLIPERSWARSIALLAWFVAALNIVGFLDPAMAFLDSLTFPVGERRLSVLALINALLLLGVLLLAARLLSRFLSVRIEGARMLTPSIKALTQKALNIALLTAAFLISIDFLGVDLTGFAVFTGALGVGVGFGLQKVVSNLISGFILLLDRSIKPGDVIELDETFGWVTSLGARYVALSTRDGKEWLIPNEDLITQRVINWSYRDSRLRLPMRFGISYHSEVRLAMELAVQAAASVDRVLGDPLPVCRLTGFGDSSVEFELRVWIGDPQGGIMNVRSDVYLAMWETFRQHGIEIPFAQRDLHIKGDSRLTVDIAQAPST